MSSSACPLRQGARGRCRRVSAGTERSASIWDRPKRCLVLLLPRVSGSGTMNDSRCASTSTTTRRLPLAAEVSRGRGPRDRATCSATRRACITSASRRRPRIDEARSAVAALLNADPSEIVFTSGGTESDNFAIRGAADALEPSGRRHLIASAIEHEAVLNTLQGARAPRLAHDARCRSITSGIVSPDRLREVDHRRHGARLGDARQQRDRHDPADRRAGRRSRTSTAR